MTVKELKEQVAAIPEELGDAEVYVYSGIDEGADQAYKVKVYDKEYYENKEKFEYWGTPYCKGDAPWDLIDEQGKLKCKRWDGEPAFVVIE